MTLVAIAVVFCSLFVLAFMTKRRYGVLAMALAAGVDLAQNASGYVGDFLLANDVQFQPLGARIAAIILVTIAPAVIMLISGPTYRSKRAALVSSLAFAVLGTLLLIGPLTATWPATDSKTRDLIATIIAQRNTLVMIGLLAAIIDTFTIHNVSPRKHAKSEKH